MSNFKIIFIVVFAALLAACDPSDDVFVAQLDLQATNPTVGTDPVGGEELGFGEAGSESVPMAMVISDCPGAKRLIGILSDGQDCSLGGTVPSTWSGTRLFEQGSPGVTALTDMPSYFARYCVFDYVGPNESLDASDYEDIFDAIEDSPHMSRDTVSADCRGEFRQGAGLYDPTVGAELHTSFMTNIDWENGAAAASDPTARTPIEVAVLDTLSQAVADDDNLDPADAHGTQISALIDRITCPTGDSACKARLRNYLAMPRFDWIVGPNWVEGGRHGTQGDLALGIYTAVHDWRQRRASDPQNTPKRLVVNLSLGWDRLDGISNQLSRGPAAALVDAMRYVNCQGGVIVVSAGNVSDGRCPQDHTGPLDPASFETLAAPTAMECAAMGATPTDTQTYPVFAAPGSYSPLVHAVGAVDEHDQDLFNMRPNAMPRVAALGANGIVDPGAEALAGTSVSAAVVSATAALVWSYRPELNAAELMELIYNAGWSIGQNAAFQYQGTDLPVRRVSVCAALQDACEGQGGSCPLTGCEATAPADDGHLTAVLDAVDAVLADPNTTLDNFSGTTAEDFTCGGEQESNNLSSPQPDLPLCARCNLTKPPGFEANDDELSMGLMPTFGGEITAARLITKDELGFVTSRWLGPEVIASLNGQPHTVDVTRVLVEAGDAVSAGVEFMLADGSTQSNRIPVIQRSTGL